MQKISRQDLKISIFFKNLLATGSRLAQYSISLHEFLGHGICKISIINSALLTAVSIFYVYSLGNHLPVIVYYFLTRFTYIKPLNDYIVTRYFDSIIISALTLVWLFLSLNGNLARISISSIFGILLAISIIADLPSLMSLIELATLPLIVFFLFCQKRKRSPRSKEIVRNFSLSLTLNYLIIIAIILGVFSILISLSVILASQSFSVENIFTTKRIPVDNYGYEMFVFFSTLSPLLLIVIFFGFPAKLLGKAILQRIAGFKKKNWLPYYELVLSEEPLKKKLRTVTYLSLFVLLSTSLALIPQLPTVNKDNQQIGSDSDGYVRWVTRLNETTTLEGFLKTAFIDFVRGDRPISLIFLFFFTSIIDAPLLDAVEYTPVILGPALVFVVYFFTRELTKNETTSLFAASLTGLGYFQVSMGIYAGFYANWIALVFGYSSLIFFFRFLRKAGKTSLLIFFVLLLATLFSHAYTWTVFTIVMSIFLVVSFVLKSFPRKNTILLSVVVMLSVVIDVVKTVTLESFRSVGGVELTLSLAQSSIGLKDFGLVWETLVDATQHHYGGILSNFVILGLVIYWLIHSKLRTDFNMFFIVFLMIGIPPLFLGDWIVQSRVFYNIPFQIPAAIALTYISMQKKALKILPPIYVWLVAISVWTVSNFYEVLPS